MKKLLWILLGVAICAAIGYVGYSKWESAMEAFNAARLEADKDPFHRLEIDLQRELHAVPLNSNVDLAELCPFEWDTVEIVNSPMGVEGFGWAEIHAFSEEDAFWFSAYESIAALIFRLDGEIVAIEFSNYHNPCSFVFRPYLHDDASDHAQYPREEAIFRADHIGSFGEKVFLPA